MQRKSLIFVDLKTKFSNDKKLKQEAEKRFVKTIMEAIEFDLREGM